MYHAFRSVISASLLCFVLLISSKQGLAQTSKTPQSIAFYYGDIDSTRELLSYERVVVSPEQLSSAQLQQLKSAKTQVFAYLSLGEASEQLAPRFSSAVLGYNDLWQASIMDSSAEPWRQYLLTQAQQLRSAGYDGFFLDTLDSYQLVLDKAQFGAQQNALISLIGELQTQGPVLLNRGFELYQGLAQPPLAVVAESLFHSYDYQGKRYRKQSKEDAQWLTGQLQQVQASQIEAIVIDYLPADDAQRLKAAQQIAALGFTPYISDPMLYQFGVSTRYPVRRRVLGLYDSSVNVKKQSECHRFLATLIEYQGYVPQCIDIQGTALPKLDWNRYAAAVFWLPQVSYQQSSTRDALLQSLDTLPTVLVGELPEQTSLLARLGVKQQGNYRGVLQLDAAALKYPLPKAQGEQYPRYRWLDEQQTSQLSLIDEQGQQGIAVASSDWGGLWLEPLTVQELPGERMRWPLDPFEHLLPLLRLAPIPSADITSESGQRIVTAHIDGDGFPSRAWLPGKPFAGASIYNNILRRSKLPHTVSVIEAEVAKTGLYPELTPELEAIARDIFALDNVEIASHTFSHPFFWDPRIEAKEKLYGDALAVPGYVLDYDREIFTSVRYINEHLAPKDKRVEVYLWSGAANPTADIIAKVAQLGLYNVNGGNTYVLTDNYSIAQVTPHLNWYKDAVQVYAPVMNENLYTELWTENFSGFGRAIETFELLGEPRRLKPVSVYYHMYSGVYPASLSALEKIYDWVDKHPLTPLYLSEYAHRARALYETGLAKSINDEAWYITSTGVKSMRIDKAQSPSGNSQGVAGVNAGPDGNYVTLSAVRARLELDAADTPFSGNLYLQGANGVLEHWQQQGGNIDISFMSHQPLQARFAQARGCRVQQHSGAPVTHKFKGDQLILTSKHKGRVRFTLSCAGQPQGGKTQ
ncbi:endo alpha-1,4 polygalactosaminidase [Pseudoalteromonas sp. T1lg75]|uniref:endo alpha-1,4 polygalactosaminidase n=1 Tax=Pseudoalteromonas sp. T1lg75 TaxID=2077102 RepID=UPI000CF64784|nr:endo alpha-1,4 polygalactosaminidase [Pseudoalteromonas sp. T1lg75]